MDNTLCIAGGIFLCYNIPMKKTEDIMLHPLWFGPVLLLFCAVLIQTLHTLTHWQMQIDADAWCRNNAEWVESNTGYNDDDY